MQTQTAVPTDTDFLLMLANTDQDSANEDETDDEELEEVAAEQHVSHGDSDPTAPKEAK